MFLDCNESKECKENSNKMGTKKEAKEINKALIEIEEEIRLLFGSVICLILRDWGTS